MDNNIEAMSTSTESIHHVCGLKESDLNEFFLAHDPEFNNEDLHDRVLIFDVMNEQRQTNNAVSTTTPILGVRLETCSIAVEVILPSPCAEGGLNLKEIEVISEQVKVSERKRHLDDAEQQQSQNKKSRAEYESDIDENIGTAVPIQVETTTEFGNDKLCTNENMAEYDFVNSEPVTIRAHKIFVHATFLAVHSKYFRAMFYSGMKEATSKEVHIKIHESEEQSHLKMLEAIYRPYILDNSSMEEFIADCEMIINCIEIKQKMPSTSDLAETVRGFLASEFNPFDTKWETDKFTSLSETLLRVLLGCENLETRSENTIFHALMYWIVSTGYNYHIIPNETESLLSLVKFGLLTIDYLYHVVQYHHIAKEMPSFSELYLNGITYHALPSSMKNIVPTRPKSHENTEQYTWVITKDEMEALRQKGRLTAEETENEPNIASDNCLISPRFWWCGYEMQMNMFLTKTFSLCLYGKLHLLVHGLKKRSRLPVKWFIRCDEIKFWPTSFVAYTIFTFETKSSGEDVIIRKRPEIENGRLVVPQAITIGICISHDPSRLR
ncbi:kelch 20 [Paramuricea clavata]|nr:kelch 20 [Paramuricea clavata]